MIRMEDVKKELDQLKEEGAMTWDTMEKMACLITVLEYIQYEQGDPKIGFRGQPGRSTIRPTQGGELENIEQNMTREEIANEFNRHMDEIRNRHPMDYENTVRRMRENYYGGRRNNR